MIKKHYKSGIAIRLDTVADVGELAISPIAKRIAPQACANIRTHLATDYRRSRAAGLCGPVVSPFALLWIAADRKTLAQPELLVACLDGCVSRADALGCDYLPTPGEIAEAMAEAAVRRDGSSEHKAWSIAEFEGVDGPGVREWLGALVASEV